MNDEQKVPVYSPDADTTYLDIQAEVGISKHMGGFEATNELHGMCHIETAEEVLEVGCGIGVGAVYLVEQFGCRVVSVDISEKMLYWAKQRAQKEGVAEQITFRKADVRQLPFEDERFDAVLVESVLSFVQDKDTAIQEIIRVTKPGGYIGLNESYLTEGPFDELLSQSAFQGMEIMTDSEWRSLWEAAPLKEKEIRTYRLSAKRETQDRIKWIGWRYILPAWGRVIKLLLTKPASRESIRMQLDQPPDMIQRMGYGLFVGRVPRAG
jgi:ubiquinone/menaquinone biosynthesis C-methylase UbiE